MFDNMFNPGKPAMPMMGAQPQNTGIVPPQMGGVGPGHAPGMMGASGGGQGFQPPGGWQQGLGAIGNALGGFAPQAQPQGAQPGMMQPGMAHGMNPGMWQQFMQGAGQRPGGLFGGGFRQHMQDRGGGGMNGFDPRQGYGDQSAIQNAGMYQR